MQDKRITLPVAAAVVVLLVSLPIAASAHQNNDPPGQQPPSVASPGPSISGTTVVGNTLTASSGDWDGVKVSYDYQWQRCDSSGDGCSDIGGSVSTSYGLGSGDVGATLRVVVTATNKNGSAFAVSDASGVIGPVPAPAPTPAPTPTPTTAPTTTAAPAPSPPQTTTSSAATPSPSSGAPASQTGRWYASTAAFNTPIPSNPPIHPDNALMISKFVPQGSNASNNYWLGPRNSSPTYGPAAAAAYPTASTPNVTVQLNYPSCNSKTFQLPIPAGTNVGVSGAVENKLVLMLPNGDEWDFYNMTPPNQPTVDYTNEAGFAHCTPNGNWQALQVQQIPGGWTGDGAGQFSWSDSSLPLGEGMIRQRDISGTPAGGTWDHALELDYAFVCSGSGPHPNYVYPASSTGAPANSSNTCAPMGSRFQLDPSINCATWPSLQGKPEWLMQMCRTLQVYGAIVSHAAACQGCGDGLYTEWYANLGGWKYPWQNADGSVSDYYSPNMNIPGDLLSHFRVIDWTRWTH